MDNKIRLTYTGPARYAGALAQELEERGTSADYDPPFEKKDLSTALEAVAVLFTVTGSVGDIIAAVKAFKAGHQGTQVEGLPEEERPSVRDRLAEVDALLADGTISPEEHAAQRKRILESL